MTYFTEQGITYEKNSHMQNLPPLKITVIPRKRKNAEKNNRQPITLDKETLEEYQQYSQREAAEKLDISLTALKNA